MFNENQTKRKKAPKTFFNAEQIKSVFTLYQEGYDLDEIARQASLRNRAQVAYLVKQIRSAGVNLPRRNAKRNSLKSLIRFTLLKSNQDPTFRVKRKYVKKSQSPSLEDRFNGLVLK